MGLRTLIFLRHGQYEASGGSLTSVGREQARLAGKYLATLPIDGIWASTLPRAKETANIALHQLGGLRVRLSALLREGLYTKVAGYESSALDRKNDRDRADAAYAKLVKSGRVDRTELIVCHGNLIRYFVCRALHMPVARWLRMSTNHCALTRILVRSSGAVRVASYNETSHLPVSS